MRIQDSTSQGLVNSLMSKGGGPTVVLLPGNSCDARVFKRQLKSDLRKDFKMIAIGINPIKGEHAFRAVHAEEDCSMIQRSAYVALEVLHARGIDPKDAVFFGHGYGANVALQIAKWQEDKGESVKGVVTAGYAFIDNKLENIADGYRFSPEVAAALGKEALEEADAQLFADAIGFDPQADAFVVEAARATDGAYRTELFASYAKGLNERVYLQNSKIPVLALHGALDSNVRLDNLEAMAASRAGIKVKVIKDAPQVCFWTHAEKVNSQIRKFVESVA